MSLIPDSWTLTTVGDITLPVSTVDPTSSQDREIQYIDIGSIDNQRNKIADPKRVSLSSAPSRARQIVKSGDVLFATVRPYLRNIAQVPDRLDDEIASTGFAVLRPAAGVEPRYLYYKAISHDFVAALTGEQYGVSYPAVKDDQVRARPIELPPTNEQRRIVAKIEELFSELDQSIESLAVALRQLKAYRQAVLKHAFESKLTEIWRTKNSDKISTPDALLELIKAERVERYKTALDEWRVALTKWRSGGEKPAKPKPPRPLSKLADAKKTNGVWPIVELGDLLSVSSGIGLTAQQMRDGPFAVYGGNGINGNHDEYFVEEPELVIGRVGAKCGVTHITRPKSWVTDNALIVTPLIYSFEKRFFKWLLEIKNLNILGSSTGQPVISGSKIYPVEVSLPSFAEQVEIVRILETKLTSVDTMEAEIEVALARAEALRQAILKRAFSGQLVAQDSADEPASILLERIRAERQEGRTTKRRSNKNGKKEAA